MAKKLILVHGLGGTVDETWGNFPEFLQSDPDVDFSIVSYGYESPNVFFQFWKRGPSILNIANGLLTDLEARCNLDNDEIILAGHSLGGLVIKKLLLRMKDKKINHKIRKVCFFDVPHDGSGFANVGKYIAWRNIHLRSLCRDSSELDDLNDQWVDSGLDNVLDIISIVSANDDIVSSSSSKSIYRHHRVETVNNVDHRTIVKPESRNSTVYIVFKKFILEKGSVSLFKNSASRDLNDWKSIERNHSYNFVSDEKRNRDFKSLVDALDLKKAVVRLTGSSGLGKSRILIEAVDASSSIEESSILIFTAPGYERDVKESVRKAVDSKVHGLVVVENCSVELHNSLAKEVNKTDCHLKVVTVAYDHEQVDDSIHIALSPLSDETIKQILLPILVGLDATDVDRVARFAQGYPLMATLIAEQYQKEGRLLGSLEHNSVVRRLIDGDGGVTEEEKNVLSACSLFDVFGTVEGTTGEEAKFIAENVACSSLRIFERVLNIFSKRQIIHRVGRYARLVPKPLALTLASEWWEETSYERQKQLIDNLPDSLMHSFCIQACYLDSQPNVQKFSERLFGGQSPFVQAEALLTERGSKLFRAFVEVNPISTSHAVYTLLTQLKHDELLKITGDIRRNLIWGLEKLCFHADVFEESSWSLLLLASAENETYCNNATGMFSQLFRIHLSGTEAPPNLRFGVLVRALETNNFHFDMVALEALSEAISIHGGSRIVGAEYQGTRAPLQEWQPKLWQEIFDYWQESFRMMLGMLHRGDAQKTRVLSEIGQSIRGFANRGRIQMLDEAIKHIVTINGRYWPAALESIKHAFEYDSKGMEQTVIDALKSWLDLLTPDDADLQEKLKILVIDPPWEHRKGEDGQYIDVAAENARLLGKEVAKDVASLTPHLHLLLQGVQKQSYLFGCQLALSLEDSDELMEQSFKHLLQANPQNPSFIFGLHRGIFEKSPEKWEAYISKLLLKEPLVTLYPDLICTGDIRKEHLDTLLGLISSGVIAPSGADVLSYGSVTNSITPQVMMDFCSTLADFGDSAAWTALNVIYMYCFGSKDRINILQRPLKQFITKVPLHKGQSSSRMNVHQWHDIAKKLLIEHDQDFAISLTNQIINGCSKGFDHSNIWHFIKPLLFQLLPEYGGVLWKIFGDAIVQSEGMMRYWLQQLLDRENNFDSHKPSILSLISVENVMSWCEEHVELAPVFVAKCVNIFGTVDEKLQPTDLFIALLSRFGDNESVCSALRANMGTRGWSGSLVPYLKADKAALSPLLEHADGNVRRWVKEQVHYIDKEINAESVRDEEMEIGRF